MSRHITCAICRERVTGDDSRQSLRAASLRAKGFAIDPAITDTAWVWVHGACVSLAVQS